MVRKTHPTIFQKEREMSDDYEPRIIAFCCNWCSYAGADLAGVSRIQYPPVPASSG